MRKFLTLFLCSTVLCMTVACGTKTNANNINDNQIENVNGGIINTDSDEATSTPMPTNTPMPTATLTPTPIPENLAMVVLEDTYDLFLESLNNMETDEVENEFTGYDLNMDITVADDLRTMFELGEFKKISMDAKVGTDIENLKYSTSFSLSLNDVDELLSIDLIGDNESFYLNAPKYSNVYMMSSFEEILGMSLEDFLNSMVTGVEDMPTEEAIKDLASKYFKKFCNIVKPDMNFETTVAQYGDYSVEGIRNTLVLTMTDLNNLLYELSEDLKEYESLNVTYEELDLNFETIYIDYIVGKNDEYAIILRFDDYETNMGYIFTKNGLCCYTQFFANEGDVEEDSEQCLFYTTVNSKENGKENCTLYVLDEYTNEYTAIDYTVENEVYTIFYEDEYDNYIEISLKFDKDFVFKADVSYDGLELVCDLEGNDKVADMYLSFGVEGMDMISMDIKCEMKNNNLLDTPSNFLDMATWMNTLDMEKLSNDLVSLQEKYTELYDIIADMIASSQEIDDYYYEEDYYNDYNVGVE